MKLTMTDTVTLCLAHVLSHSLNQLLTLPIFQTIPNPCLKFTTDSDTLALNLESGLLGICPGCAPEHEAS